MCPGILPATGWMAQGTFAPSAFVDHLTQRVLGLHTTAMAQPGTMMTETAFFLDHTATPPTTQIGGLSCLSFDPLFHRFKYNIDSAHSNSGLEAHEDGGNAQYIELEKSDHLNGRPNHG